MKFHNNIKTVLIVISVTVLFFVSSMLILFNLNLTSPTLIVTESILDSFSSADSDFSLSFDGMERNFRDRILINNLSLYYKGEKIAFFEKTEVKLGLFDIISYFFNFEGSAEIDFLTGNVNVDTSLFSASEEKDSSLGDITLPSFLNSHNLILTFKDIDVSIDGTGGNVDELTLSYVAREEKLVGDGEISSFRVKVSGYDILLNNTAASFSWGKTIYVSVDLGKVELKGESIYGSVENIELSLTTDDFASLKDGKIMAVLNIDSISLEYDGITLDTKANEVCFTPDNVTASIVKITGGVSGYSYNVNGVDALLEGYDNYTISSKGAYFSSDKNDISLDSLKITGSLKNENAEVSVEKITSDISSLTSSLLGVVDLSSINGNLNYSEGLSVSLSLASTITTPSEKIDDISFSFGAEVDIKENEISNARFDLTDLYLGYGERYNSSVNVSGNLDSAVITLDYGSFDIDLVASLKKSSLEGSLIVDSLPVLRIKPLLNEGISSLFEDESIFSLSSYFDLSFKDGVFSGDLDYSVSLDSMKISFIKTDLSSSGRLTFEDKKINIHKIKVDTSFFTSTFNGYWDKERKLPSLDFTSNLINGDELLNGYIHLEDDRSYHYEADFAYFKNMIFDGVVDFNTDKLITSKSTLTTGDDVREFTLLTDLEKKEISLKSDNLISLLDFSDGIRGRFEADSLRTLRSPAGVPITIDGIVGYSFSLEEGLHISSNSIEVGSFFYLPNSPTLSFMLNMNDDQLELSYIKIKGENTFNYTGLLKADFVSNTLALTFDETGGDGSILFSLYKDAEFVAALKADKINLTPVGLEDMYAQVTLYGRANKIEDFAFNGNVSVTSPSDGNRKINGSLTIDSSRIVMEDIIYSSDDFNATLPEIYFDSVSGKFEISNAVFNLTNSKPDRDYPLEAAFSLSGETEKSDSLFYSLVNLISRKGSGTDLVFKIDYLDADSSTLRVDDRNLSISIRDDKITLGGNFLSGTLLRTEKRASFYVDLPGLTVASFNLDFASGLKVNASVDEFNMGIVNLLMKFPTLVFRDDLVSGKASFVVENGRASLNGSLEAEELGVDVFWLENETLILHNPRFILWDNDLSSSYTYATVLDKLTQERNMVRMTVGISLSDTLSLDGWDVNVYIDDDNPIRVRIPLPKANIDILGYTAGHYHAYSDDNGMYNEGTLNISDAEVSVGMNPYPDWYNLITGAAFVDMTLNFKNNNRILYPAGDDPIFSITLQDDSYVYAFVDSSSVRCSGDVQIRGGEIFYFQKYFYITSGSIRFDDPNELNPKISLRATLRDYDSSSERVEIYLVMKDNTFDNISPTLESSPAKELSEIMEILGQSILPQSAYGSVSVSSVASLVTEGYDILSRLGIVTTATNPLSSLSSSLKNVFGVDTFSLHSNILNNIVTDTITQATAQNGTTPLTTFSPMARFLNGTTLNVGKYLSQNLYLQIMVHLEATSNRDKYTIIADDLALDTEFSLEWTELDAFNVTFFTTPSYFSFISILDTFGFTITKTINF